MKYKKFISIIILFSLIPYFLLPHANIQSYENTTTTSVTETIITTPSVEIIEILESFDHLNLPFFQDGRFSYENLLIFLDSLENENLEALYTEKEMNDITELIIILAKNGILFEDEDYIEEIEKDWEKLLIDEDNLSPYIHYSNKSLNENYFNFSSYDDFQNAEIHLCKGFFKKCFKKVKKFVKKHKKALIIGAVVVTAVVTSVVLASKTAEKKSDEISPDKPKNTDSKSDEEGQENKISSNEEYVFENNKAPLKEIIQENLICAVDNQEAFLEKNNFNETLNDNLFKETMVDFGSGLAHEILDSVAELVSFVPRLVDECKTLANNWFPNDEVIQEMPMGKFEEFKTSCHNVIDQIFDTDYAELYSIEYKNDKLQLEKEIGIPSDVGILPPPGALGFKAIKKNGCLLPTQANNIRGWKLGEPINNRTITGKVPKWNTVRQRFWKNEAFFNSSKYKSKDIKRMKKGLPPQRINPDTQKIESMELHHIPPQREGGLFDVEPLWPDDHAKKDKFRHTGN